MFNKESTVITKDHLILGMSFMDIEILSKMCWKQELGTDSN